jgi:ribosome-associated protein
MRRQNQEPESSEVEDEGPSKTQLKKALLELQDLALALLQLPDDQLDELVNNEGLRDSLRDLRRIASHGARKRQMQYVAKLLRDAEVEPFRKALAALHAGKARDAKAMHDVEQWRERMLAKNDEGLNAWVKAHPASDTPQLRALIRDARRDRAKAAGTDERGNGRAFRELFKIIRTVLHAAREAGKG